MERCSDVLVAVPRPIKAHLKAMRTSPPRTIPVENTLRMRRSRGFLQRSMIWDQSPLAPQQRTRNPAFLGIVRWSNAAAMNPFRLVRTLLSLSLAAFNATAATLTWNNPAGGAWNEAANWTPNQIPGPLDSVVIDLAGN
jgi:hypothetical protein